MSHSPLVYLHIWTNFPYQSAATQFSTSSIAIKGKFMYLTKIGSFLSLQGDLDYLLLFMAQEEIRKLNSVDKLEFSAVSSYDELNDDITQYITQSIIFIAVCPCPKASVCSYTLFETN